MKYSMGALAPKVDTRDYTIRAAAAVQLPEAYHLVDLPPVKNQGAVGSCVAHTCAEILEYFNQVETGEFKALSTDFIYGMQGLEFGRMEAGMYLRDACKIVNKYGDCSKKTLGSNTEQPQATYVLNNILTDEIYEEAKLAKTASYASCKNDTTIKTAILSGSPILASVKWYDKYTKEENGVLKMDTNSSFGYHAIMIYGWDTRGWLCQNSWGKEWNDGGHFVIPFGEIKEAWSFVDENQTFVKKPINNIIFNLIYKIVNYIINFLKEGER